MIQPCLSFLNQDQCAQIHQAALEILRRTGVRVFHEEALRLLAEADCLVRDENRVSISEALVEWALRQPPSRVALCIRGSNRISAALQERNVNFGLGSDCPNYLDPRSGVDPRCNSCIVEGQRNIFRWSLDVDPVTGAAHQQPAAHEVLVLCPPPPAVIPAYGAAEVDRRRCKKEAPRRIAAVILLRKRDQRLMAALIDPHRSVSHNPPWGATSSVLPCCRTNVISSG